MDLAAYLRAAGLVAWSSWFFLALCLAPTARSQDTQASRQATVFRIKYVAEGAVYISAGRNENLREGMALSVVHAPADGQLGDGIRFRGDAHLAELKVTSVADASAVCEVVKANGEITPGQVAFLTPTSVEERRQEVAAVEAKDYPIVVTFTQGDPMDEEIHAEEAKKVIDESPMSHIRGRFGVDYGGTTETGGLNTKQTGMVIDADMANIGGTYWSFTGYWRGNLSTSSTGSAATGTPTLTDLINRTYHLGFTYQSPYSPLVIGVGRLFLPWAPSLSTIDGGYLGRKITRTVTFGFFAGSTPDPTSWSYNPNQHIAGTFVNYERGNFDGQRIFTTAGIAVTSIQWRVARQFAFFETNYSWKRNITFYNSLQADAGRTSPLVNGGSNPTGVTQSYTSLHVQPVRRLTLGINHNYFRNLPTFDPALVGTGLLDQYLFQGFSGDVRVELPKHVAVYSSLGKSKVSTDTKASLNQAYGITFAKIGNTGLLADAHYSKFNSSFGGGQYESISLSRSITESMRVQVLGGHQIFHSSLTLNTTSDFVNGSADWNVGARYFLEGNYGWYQGSAFSYRQWSTVFGYRFGGYRHR